MMELDTDGGDGGGDSGGEEKHYIVETNGVEGHHWSGFEWYCEKQQFIRKNTTAVP